MQKNGRTLREDIVLIRRGLKEFEAMLAGQMKHIYRRNFLAVCCFYLPVGLSAAVIEELLSGKNIDQMVGLIVSIVFVTFVLTLWKNVEDAKVAVGYSYLFCAHEIYLTNHTHQLPFEILERNSTKQLRDWVSGSINTSGGGMASLYWDMDTLSANICSVLAALGFCIYSIWNTVLQCSRVGMDSGVFIKDSVRLFVLVGVCAWVSCKTAGRRFDVSFQIFQEGAKCQRFGEYYTIQYLSDENAALDARIYHQTDKIVEESQKNCYQPFWKGKQRELRAVNRCDGIKLLCSCVCGSVVYLTAAQKAVAGVIGAGSIVIIYVVVMQLIDALSNAAQTLTDLRNNNEHLIRYFQYMDLAENAKEQQELPQPQCCKEITFCNVGFQYPESEKWVLKNISFTIKRGEKVTIVGENGSGKTTLIKLLCRLYQPTEGVILLNGRDIQSYSNVEYMGYISAVFQEIALFAFPLAENISASSVYQKERIWNCLAKAGIKEKVSQWERGIHQPLFHDFDEDGVDLSGGEAQKVAIARALYKESQILVLDEPTAALDPYAEAELFENFYQMTSDNQKIVLFISHRMSSCRMCDRIIVIDKGCVIQCGSHAQLLKEKDQKYYKMWNAQAQYYI